ncbi:MAG TPA: dicarboxylate/amino acid:cation symporter [Smithellaceae bacterium]|jgi:Na+/H+-dicarboxylate symporter|nr:dicarboxylate/amino acid:cation symporter [Syntrophaceae bacterium]NMD05228.1 dicarboxylate/amino acid:cation symporter [Deltaproteobacteria bacterium]HOF77368.1 dicarboxylate/amino acid:cation symporter [Smithellaceae bacterium]MBP8607946.1 dicarboxylate/amino acid:cation symporter [Syntrophaceae bacterium]HOM68735.1 dicarboxylate/amino acid:cation symporter [Smithellaceae bacterium]
MKLKLPTFLSSYGFSITLIISLFIGTLLGIIFKQDAAVLKPFGDIFLNLLFTAIIPLVFFSISSSVASITNVGRLGKIIFSMLLIFILTGIIASVVMIIGVTVYPPATGVVINFGTEFTPQPLTVSEQIVKALTTPDFADILSKKNMLALIIFSVLIGLATSTAGEKGKFFSDFLSSGNSVMTKMISFIMYYAPIGLCAYFAYLIGISGEKLLGSYARVMILYFPVAILYFFIAFSIYVTISAGNNGLRKFWRNIIPPSLIALATGSSIATIPSNLQAADKIGVPKEIREVIIPIGATMHMEGSCLAAVLKIAFLFGIFNMNFAGTETILTALGIALLTGIVVSGIPGGGTIGELMIISFYGFPPEVFPIIMMIGTIVDAPATMVNAVGDNVSSIMVARIMEGKHWIK